MIFKWSAQMAEYLTCALKIVLCYEEPDNVSSNFIALQVLFISMAIARVNKKLSSGNGSGSFETVEPHPRKGATKVKV